MSRWTDPNLDAASRERFDRRTALLDEAVKAYAEAELEVIRLNRQKTEEQWRIERVRNDIIRSIAGCQENRVQEIYDAVMAILRR